MKEHEVATQASPSSATSAQPPSGSGCLTTDQRSARIESAWVSGERVWFCARPQDSEENQFQKSFCFSVDPKVADYREEPNAKPVAVAKSMKPELDPTGGGGRYTFRLKGGLRTPKGALVELEDVTTKKTKRAPLDYDEHVVIDGWVGEGLVLRTWVDEGPGCGRYLFHPLTRWPLKLDDGEWLGSCYGSEELVFATKDAHAFVDGSRSSVWFVDDATLAITEIAPGQTFDPEARGVRVPSAPVGGELIVLLGPPLTGDVERIDLDDRKLVDVASPRTCAPD